MKQVVLNGGNFGGTTVEIEDQTKIVMTDTNGMWCYDLSLNPATTTAEFVGMVQSPPDGSAVNPVSPNTI